MNNPKTLALLSNLLLFVISVAGATGKTCAFTEVSGSSCNTAGWVQAPDTLAIVEAFSALSCAKECASTERCRSIRYIQASSKCFLYGKYLEGMDTDFTATKPGRLYDRRIAACHKTDKCARIGGLFSPSFMRFACAYGYTARPYHGYPTHSFTIDGNTTTCCAAATCAGAILDGVFDVHFHKPSQQWVCTVWENDPGYDYSLDAQGAGPGRYTLRNNTVGAGYGYALTHVESEDHKHHFCK